MNNLTVSQFSKLAFGTFEFIDAVTGDIYDYVEASEDIDIKEATVTAIYAIDENSFRVYFERYSY